MHHHRGFLIAVTLLFSLVAAPLASAQSQETKPIPPAQEASGAPIQGEEAPAVATPLPAPDLPGIAAQGGSYTSPIYGYSVSWDEASWQVEGDISENGYDGLQLGTPRSTLYLEGYVGFDGDAGACLIEAIGKVSRREGVSDAAALPGRATPLPVDRVPDQMLLKYTQTFADGSSAEMIELVACQSLGSAGAVLETTYQIAESQYADEMPLAAAVLETVTMAPAGTI